MCKVINKNIKNKIKLLKKNQEIKIKKGKNIINKNLVLKNIKLKIQVKIIQKILKI